MAHLVITDSCVDINALVSSGINKIILNCLCII